MSIHNPFGKLFFSALMLVLATATGAHDKMPEVSQHGLHLAHDSKLRVVYMKPDLMTAGMNQTLSASAGEMTLYMELLDGATGAIIGRVIDPEAAA